MSIVVALTGRLGNNLFQYSLGRILAEELQLELRCIQGPPAAITFMGKPLDIGPAATLGELIEYFPQALLRIPGTRVEAPVERFELSSDIHWDGTTIDLTGLLRDRTPRSIRLDGYFQKYAYFQPFAERIRQWLFTEPLLSPYNVGARDVVVSIRRGYDFGILNLTLSMAYYHEALSRLGSCGKVYVCGTGIDDQVRASLAPYDPIYYDASPIDHFRFIKEFRRIVLSNSTFAWWAAFLSEANQIVGPRSKHGDWFGLSGDGIIELAMSDRNYMEIDVDTRAELAFRIADGVASLQVVSHAELSLAYSDGKSIRLHIDGTYHPLLLASVETKTPLSLRTLRQYMRDEPQVRMFLQTLIENRVVDPIPIYLDNG